LSWSGRPADLGIHAVNPSGITQHIFDAQLSQHARLQRHQTRCHKRRLPCVQQKRSVQPRRGREPSVGAALCHCVHTAGGQGDRSARATCRRSERRRKCRQHQSTASDPGSSFLQRLSNDLCAIVFFWLLFPLGRLSRKTRGIGTQRWDTRTNGNFFKFFYVSFRVLIVS